MNTDTIIQNYQLHHYYNYVYMNKTIRLKKRTTDQFSKDHIKCVGLERRTLNQL
jgi:hypothetical protein